MAIQKIRLTPSQVLTVDNIQKTLYNARAGYDYCRIDMKMGRYIIVAFFRDGKYAISTNIWSMTLFNEMRYAENNISILHLSQRLFKWIQTYNR